MEFAYVLYSYTRKVLYVHEQDHARFWSKYIRNKYPKDRWFVGRDTDVAYIELMRNVTECRRINLMDSTDMTSKKLQQEIYEAMEQNAIINLDATTFVVYHENRGEIVLDYIGPNIHDAVQAFGKSSKAEYIEVWKNGRFFDNIYSELDFYAKVSSAAV